MTSKVIESYKSNNIPNFTYIYALSLQTRSHIIIYKTIKVDLFYSIIAFWLAIFYSVSKYNMRLDMP